MVSLLQDNPAWGEFTQRQGRRQAPREVSTTAARAKPYSEQPQAPGAGQPPAGGAIIVASYNIHAWVGSDRRRDPERTAGVIRSLGADVVGLQEVTWPRLASGQPDPGFLQRATGMLAVAGPTMLRTDADFGNALLSAHPVLRVRRLDLTWPGREPRGALDVELDVTGRRLRVITTHLGMRSAERRLQARMIAATLDHDQPGPVVVMGDMNEWLPLRRTFHPIEARLGKAPAPASYPARWPLLRLDRIWTRPVARLQGVFAVASGEARRASDHLPVVGHLAAEPVAGDEES